MAVYEAQIAKGRIDPDLGLIESAVSAEAPKVRNEIIADKRAEAPENAAFAVVVAMVYGFAALVPRKPWAWTFSLVMICTTMLPFIITLAGTIPLILAWVKPDMKIYFKRPSS